MRLYFVPPFRTEIKKIDEKERLYYFHFFIVLCFFIHGGRVHRWVTFLISIFSSLFN